MNKKLKILVACEESQAVTVEMRKLGHEAYSCDMQECSGGHPEWHIMGDALQALHGGDLTTMDGTSHYVEKWDMLIAHPPCTYLSNAGAARLYPQKGILNEERLRKGIMAKDFFMEFWKAEIPMIAVENPVPSGVFCMPKYTQIVQPYEYGHPYSKKTCLWLKGLPKLKPTKIVEPVCSWVSGGSKDNHGNPRKNKGTTFRDSKTKSKTFPGIARAMAEQWAGSAEHL